MSVVFASNSLIEYSIQTFELPCISFMELNLYKIWKLYSSQIEKENLIFIGFFFLYVLKDKANSSR